MPFSKIFFIYYIIINMLTFIAFAVDKWKAVHGKWRIREFTLIGLSIIGGAAGGLAGMYIFRHKTKKSYFKFGIPIILIVQIIGIIYLNSSL